MITDGKYPISRNTLFFDDNMFKTFSEWALDYNATWTGQKLILYQVDYIRTNTDDLYGETHQDEIKYSTPIALPCRYKIDKSENSSYIKTNQNARYKQYGNLTFSVFEQTLSEYKCDIKYGDVIGVIVDEKTMIYYEVVDDGKRNFSNNETMFGYKRLYRNLIAVELDPNVFQG